MKIINSFQGSHDTESQSIFGSRAEDEDDDDVQCSFDRLMVVRRAEKSVCVTASQEVISSPMIPVELSLMVMVSWTDSLTKWLEEVPCVCLCLCVYLREVHLSDYSITPLLYWQANVNNERRFCWCSFGLFHTGEVRVCRIF